ncbi:MAG: DAK2 domain-containing protein [Oscillospiraceae bacterium]|nr:DAK2 domain-containing protein [Oscillospiraceae bacterium]MDD4414467.1 DAK2 domain-containing protein [Oscillospiraceae bacterium]
MIQGKILRDSIISASNCLAKSKQSVDELNIFPVPDGDTGTNMSMTISAASRELARLTDPTVSQVADVTSSALLRGARGNSGVILSLLFRGLSKGLKGKDEASGADLADALALGVEEAYKAVMKPTEGTILTVAREAAAKGQAAATVNKSVKHVWNAICQEADESLKRTPDLLPVLKKAGVIDAGGMGLCIILNAMKDVFDGGDIVESDSSADTSHIPGISAAGAFETDIKFTYCTEFIVEREKGNTHDPLRLRAYLESIGDSVVVVDDADIIKVHVHTNEPGSVLSEGIKYGHFETVKIENMRIQHANAAWVPEGEGNSEIAAPVRREPENEYGFVAVAAGDGLQTLFTDLGCDSIVSGGQTMNPSTEDILKAIQATPAKVVFVLPNNKNIILAAEQTIPLADRKVHVLQTRTIPQGISAMLSFNPDDDVEQNLLNMMKSANNVSTGSVTFAARNSDFEDHAIKEGEILALENGKVIFTDTDVRHAAIKLTRSIINSRKITGKETSFITLIYGDKIEEAQAEEVRDAIQAKVGNSIDITLVNGGQPIYYYFISVE